MSTKNEWFTTARFGLFVHWGIYAAASRHEWVRKYERLTEEQYQPYFDHFDPDLFDPTAWAEAAYQAGMRYVVITTKHHDGFCLWDSKLTDYSIAHTAFGRDALREIIDAFRARGLRIGLYHSLLDWHHPQFPVDMHHPQSDDAEYIDANSGRDLAIYREYLHGQVRELLTGYGQIDVMWFDFSYGGRGWNAKGAEEWDSRGLVDLIHELQPGCLINNRLGLGDGDIVTPEQVQPAKAAAEGVAWEACQTLNGSWGHHRDNLNWKPAEQLIRMLIDTVSKGGNMLLNVGPDGRGQFEPRALDRLGDIGAWMRLHERSIRGAGPSEFTPPADARYTQRGNRLYLHLFAWPMRMIHLPGLGGRIEYAQLLNDASEIQPFYIDPAEPGHLHLRNIPASTATLQLPLQRPEVTVPVIEIFLTDEPAAEASSTGASPSQEDPAA